MKVLSTIYFCIQLSVIVTHQCFETLEILLTSHPSHLFRPYLFHLPNSPLLTAHSSCHYCGAGMASQVGLKTLVSPLEVSKAWHGGDAGNLQ